MYKYLVLLVTLLVSLIIFILFLHRHVSDKATYVTSSNCQECHTKQYTSWRNNTLHPYMFLPVEHPDAKILGNFSLNDPSVTFKKEDIEYVIGSKWEQVYVQMIDGEYYPFPAKWYVIQKRWVPYKVDSWRETPLSYKCNGCHTTGFDPNTLKFEEFGVGCEACHGPGSLHIQYRQKIDQQICTICHEVNNNEVDNYQFIVKDVSPSVCGQCHNRGTSSKGDAIKGIQFNFPIDYKPGGDLRISKFTPSTPENDNKMKNWWGNGLSKNRHQEFSDWVNSPHSQSLTNMIIGQSKNSSGCGRTSSPCLECHTTDYRHAPENEKPDVYSAKLGVTCVVCHEPHGRNTAITGETSGRVKCIDCHTGMTNGPDINHHPCKSDQVQCADCHMPRIVKTGGFFSLASHALRIVPPDPSTENMPNSCQNGGCHAERDLNWAVQTYENYYGSDRRIQ